MPSKKWQTSRCNRNVKSPGKGSGLMEKGKRRRPGSPPTIALPILNNPVLQRSNSRASSRLTSSTLATLAHSRAIRAKSPARASSPRNVIGTRPRSRSLPVQHTSTFSTEKKRLRRLTLANTGTISRALFNGAKENPSTIKDFPELKSEIPHVGKSTSDLIAGEMKTPDFHSSTAVEESPQFPALPPCDSKEPEQAESVTHVLNIPQPEENPNCEILLATRFDVLLQHVGPTPRFIGIDIDDTVIVTNHSPSILLTTVGVTAFQRFVHQKFSDFKTKNALCRELEKAIKDKVPVEPKIPSVIRDLQNSGCWVFGVTARYHEMAASTDKCLKSLGINFTLASPFPPQFLRDPQTGAVCVNGIIYCNGLSKGNVLNRFFENVVLRNVLAKKNKDASLPCPSDTKSTSSSIKQNRSEITSSVVGLPDRFIFIDDQRSQAECISKDLSCARTLNIPITCYHYVPDIFRDPCEKMDRRQRGTILLKQMMYFIEKKIILSNQEALLQCKNTAITTSVGSCSSQVTLSNSFSGVTSSTSGSSSAVNESMSGTKPSASIGLIATDNTSTSLGGQRLRDPTSTLSIPNNNQPTCKPLIKKNS